MKYSLFLLCGIVLLALGCAENEQADVVSPDVSYDELVPLDRQIRGTMHQDQIAGMTLEHRGRRYFEHLTAYTQLMETEPNDAFEELKRAATIVWSAHPRSVEWALLTFRMDGTGNASLSEKVHQYELELEMARDIAEDELFVFRLEEAEKEKVRNAYKDMAEDLETPLAYWQGEKAAAEARGQNPDYVFIEFTVELVADGEEEEKED